MMAWKNIGKIGPPQGLNGAFFLVGSEDFDSDSSALMMGQDPSCGVPVSLQNCRYSQGHWVFKIQGVDSRQALDAVRGQELWVQEQEEIEHELIGTQVLDDTGAQLGRVIAVTNYGASDIVVVQGEENRLLDLPLVADYFALPSVNKTLELKIPQATFAELWYS